MPDKFATQVLPNCCSSSNDAETGSILRSPELFAVTPQSTTESPANETLEELAATAMVGYELKPVDLAETSEPT